MVLTDSYSKTLLKGKVAVVTGGGSGIGRWVAQALARHGASVALAARKLDRLQAAADEIAASGGQAAAFPCDVAEADQVKALAKAVIEKFGKADILINNAAANFIWPSEKLTAVRWRKVVDIVLNGSFYCTRYFGEHMLARKSGRIVNILAAYAETGAPGLLPSAAAKAGVLAMTKTLGAEWAGRGVLVNAVAPGPIDTPQTRERLWPSDESRAKLLSEIPLGRFGLEEDVAAAVMFLVSDLGRNITGEMIVADGGHSLGKGAAGLLTAA